MFGVIIPIWNGERFLEECIISICKQTRSDWELVLVDDGSTDSSPIIAKKFAKSDRRISYVHQINSRVAKARNRGFHELSENIQYVLFIDQDDYLELDALENLSCVLSQHPEAPAIYGLGRLVNAQGEHITKKIEEAFGYIRYGIRDGKRIRISENDKSTYDVLAVWPQYMTPGQMLIRKDSLLISGLFDPQAEPADEWELGLRLSIQSGLVFYPKFVVNKRCHEHNALSMGIYKSKNMDYIRKKMADREGPYSKYIEISKSALKLSIKFNLNVMFLNIKKGQFRGAASRIINIISDKYLYMRLYGE
jgi:glycosyltransferase involved in cell wall biosynthesis